MPRSKSSNKVQVISSEEVYRGPVFWVTLDHVREPGGIEARRDVVRHPGSVVVLPVDDSGREPRILLERQYRHSAGKRLWELPAGRIDPGESELAGAKRELIEETGYRAKYWKRILRYYASPGFLDETMAIFLARGLVRGIAAPEEDELIRTRFFPLSTALRMVERGLIPDGKTIAGILWLTHFGGRKRR